MELNVAYLKEIMKEKNWTIGQFAIKTKLSPTTISRILSGKRGAGPKVIGAIFRVLPKESLDGLFFWN